MVAINEIQQKEILRIESEMNNLWGELNTSTIPPSVRKEIEQKLESCEENFKKVLGGQASINDLTVNLHQCDLMLALAAITQAENEIPKAEHTSSAYLALQTIKRELNEGHLKPIKARHEVKEIMRHQFA